MFSVCVCFGDPCAQNFNLRDYFERLLCGLDHWLSCILDCIHVCIFLLSKNCFEKLARHILDALLSVELLKPFSYCNPDSSSIPGGSIEFLFLKLILCYSILARYLSYRRPPSRHLPRQLPRHLPIPQLSSFIEGPI